MPDHKATFADLALLELLPDPPTRDDFFKMLEAFVIALCRR